MRFARALPRLISLIFGSFLLFGGYSISFYSFLFLFICSASVYSNLYDTPARRFGFLCVSRFRRRPATKHGFVLRAASHTTSQHFALHFTFLYLVLGSQRLAEPAFPLLFLPQDFFWTKRHAFLRTRKGHPSVPDPTNHLRRLAFWRVLFPCTVLGNLGIRKPRFPLPSARPRPDSRTTPQ